MSSDEFCHPELRQDKMPRGSQREHLGASTPQAPPRPTCPGAGTLPSARLGQSPPGFFFFPLRWSFTRYPGWSAVA